MHSTVLPLKRVDGRVDVGGNVVVGGPVNSNIMEDSDSDDEVITVGDSDSSDEEYR